MSHRRRVLVLGGLGFVGRHLVNGLIGDGHDVTVTTRRPEVRADGRFRLDCVREGDPRRLACLIADTDWVFDLRARSAWQGGTADDFLRDNVLSARTLAEAMAETGCGKRLLYAGSGACYGQAALLPTPESAPLLGRDPYAASKAEAERLLLNAGDRHGFHVASLRLFNAYGPGTSPEHTVLGRFIALRRQGRPLPVTGDGSQGRDFIHVHDAARAFAAAAERAPPGAVLNLGSGCTTTVAELARLIGGPVEWLPPMPGVHTTQADISAIAGWLDWRPRITIEAGLKHVISAGGPGNHNDFAVDFPVIDGV
jgi:UDP-glucose 4-epimerase